MNENSRLLLIDGHSVAYRAFYALPVERFQTKSGKHTNAVYGFASMLLNIISKENPTHICVAFDVSRHSFRTEEYPDYKGTREKTPDEFLSQMPYIKGFLDALNIIWVEKKDYEADDLIATLSSRAADEGFEVLICSGDRDTFQLVNEKVTVLYPAKGVAEQLKMTPEAVEAKYAVSPARYPELAALVGESSDNLPGVPGVGPKTAAKWLKQFDGLDNLLANTEQITGKVGESLRSHVADVVRNRKLNALLRNVELEITPKDLQVQNPDPKKLNELFNVLEFNRFREKFKDIFLTLDEKESEPKTSEFEISAEILQPGELKNWLATNGQDKLLGVEFIGWWRAGSGDIKAVALANKEGQAAYIETTKIDPEDDAVLAAWLNDENQLKAIHDAKGPSLACWARGWNLAGVSSDTMLGAYLLNPGQRSYDLADLVIDYLNKTLRLGQAETEPAAQMILDFGIDDTQLAAQSQMSMLRAKAVLELAEVIAEKLKAQQTQKLLTQIEIPMMNCLARMESVGIAVDIEMLTKLHDEFDAGVISAEQKAWQVIGKQINLGSPKQLQAVLFDELKMPKTRKTKSGYTTDAEALAKLYAQTNNEFLAYLLVHRDQIKLRQTVDGLLNAVSDDGRIHTTYMQAKAATGRLSSTEPNLQNIPIRTEEGRRIRKAFVVGKGYETLMSADYSQIEMRLMAHICKDQSLVDAFRSGVDFHTAMAARVFQIAPEEVSAAQRSKIKAMNYGLAYGLSAYGLSQQLNISVPSAKVLMDDYFSHFGKVRDYLQQVVHQAAKAGYTETILGRRRYLPGLNSTSRQQREMAERAALNSPIQGSAADVIKVAMLNLQEALAKEKFASRMLLQIHDELIFEIATGETNQILGLIQDKMQHVLKLDVPLEISVGKGPSWFDAAH